ncbi:MAG TPA: hypothetical protein VK209_09855 [Candidatus Sulfotelmatobacter sp.]|nr:hypothetical protein [Candidatus Sulfotelmatobacter sp.]
MTEEQGTMDTKRGHVRITIDVEINEGLMEAVKEGMSKMHWKMGDMMGRRSEKE